MSTFIIAEAGINFCGSLDRALKMVELAADVGANAVKFQSFTARDLGYDEKLTRFLESVELSIDDHHKLYLKAKRCGIEFMSTPFDRKWVDFLVMLGVDRIKISSGKAKDRAFCDYIRAKELPVIVSTGMLSEHEVNAHISKYRTTVLYCVSKYPAPLNEVDFRQMHKLSAKYQSYGYSDHTIGTAAPILAAAMGAQMVEVHFTMSRALPGPDQICSKEPDELRAMVKDIRAIRK